MRNIYYIVLVVSYMFFFFKCTNTEMKMLRKVKTSMMNIVQNEHRKIIENYNSPKKYLKDGDNNLFL